MYENYGEGSEGPRYQKGLRNTDLEDHKGRLQDACCFHHQGGRPDDGDSKYQ
jgi:hypothetical protein